MQYTTLGNSEILVSEIAFGAMSLSGIVADDVALIHQAISLGINFIDTADLYQQGLNESIIGKAIKGRRREVILATKGGNQPNPNGSGWTWNPRPVYLRKALEASLRRLGTDYLDLYQLHGGTMEDPGEEIIHFFEEEKRRGTIRAYGISSIRPTVIDYWMKNSSMDSLMVQYSGLDRRAEEQIFPLLEDTSVSLLARGTVAKGLLAGKTAKEYMGIPSEEISEIVKKAFPDSAAGSMASTAIQYVLGIGRADVAVVGMSKEVQLLQAIEAVNTPPLTSERREQLDTLFPILRYEKHRL